MSESLESFSRQLLNVLHAQQSQILQALNVHSYDIHQKLTALHADVESLRNETLSQQNAFRSAFDIVAARLDEIQQTSKTARSAPIDIRATPNPNRGTHEDHRMLLDTINTRMELTEKRLGMSMGDVTKRLQVVEQSVAEVFEIVKDPRASFHLTSPDNAEVSLAELQKIIERLPQGSLAPQQPATQYSDQRLPTPAQSNNNRTPPSGEKSPEAVPIEQSPPVKPSNPPPKPNQPRQPKTPKAIVGDVRWSSRLEKQGSPRKRSVSRSVSPSKKGKELVLHSSSVPNRSLGKRKRVSGLPKSRKKRATTSNAAAKGKEIVKYNESDQPPVMVMCNKCNGWYHIKCVSVDENDACMTQEDMPYTCPPCIYPDRYTAVPQESEYDCGAPGCVIPKRQADDEVFYIDKLIGRKPTNDQNSEAQFAWLVKFDGYPVNSCLWKPEHTFDAKPLKSEFYAAAFKEGLLSSTRASSDYETLLLQEAADYGGPWNDDEA